MNRTKQENVLGVLAVVSAAISIPLSIGFISLGLWSRYERRKTEEAATECMMTMIRDDHPGLRRIVGDRAMDRAIQLVNER